MKRLIPIFILIMCLVGCSNGEITDGDTLNLAVVSQDGSVTARNALAGLEESTIATVEATRVSSDEIGDLSEYDALYIDKSVAENADFNAKIIQDYVFGGGNVFLDNDVYDLFDKEFIGAEDFVTVDISPDDMLYPENGDKSIKKIQSLLSDFSMLYRNYANYDILKNQSYGVGVIPSTAQCVAVKDNVGIYTVNNYGDGCVFFTNPLLPNYFSVNNLSTEDTGEYLSATTVGANKLMRDYFAEYVSLKKYGYAVEQVFGSYAKPVASWELHYEDITGIENGSAEIFEEMCKKYGQVPSFTLARNPYIWFRRAESVTYAINNDGKFAMDPYENAYSSGTHFVTAKEWLSLDYYDDTISYFEESCDYIKRAYPCPVDFNGDGKADLICGSADGKLYYFEGSGMKTNYELDVATMFTDSDGNQISVGGYSSPACGDIDGDGVLEIISGDENGNIHCFKRIGGMMLENQGIILETGLADAMPSLGDLNGDGIIDMAVGSRNGEMRIYYGRQGIYSVLFDAYETVETGQTWCSPCIADADGDGINELYAGTFEGYIAKFENNVFNGYIEGNESNYKGNNNLKFGTNSVPAFYDINGDGNKDLIVGSLEYGMAVPIDSEYFPYKEKLQAQLDGFKERGIYFGVHALSNEYADLFHDQRELEYQKNAFEAYGLTWTGSGVNQHTWRTSKIGYDTHFDNMSGYDGTYRSQLESGLYWNSGSQTPNSSAVPEVSAENSILVPFYLNNGQLMLQPSNTPNGHNEFSQITAKYEMPLLFYNHCDYVYKNREAEEEKIQKVDMLVNDYGYNFAQENQLAKMTAASLNCKVTAKKDENGLHLSQTVKSKDIPLYDEKYQNAVGVKIVFANNADVEKVTADANVSYVKDGCLYVSLDKDVTVSEVGASDGIKLTSVNLPSKISKTKDGAKIKFLDGGMMTVETEGMAKTKSKGWEVTQQDGKTVFKKYGKPTVLKISK